MEAYDTSFLSHANFFILFGATRFAKHLSHHDVGVIVLYHSTLYWVNTEPFISSVFELYFSYIQYIYYIQYFFFEISYV